MQQSKALAMLNKVAFYGLLAVICLYTLFPYYWAFVSSIKPNSELSQTPVP